MKITHEEARLNCKQCYSMVKTNMTQPQVSVYLQKNIQTQRYIKQQGNVEKLLGLYQKRETNRNLTHPSHVDELIYSREIKTLEDTLND